MNPIDETSLRAKFILNKKGYLEQESDDVEYKRSFDWSGPSNKKNRAKYAKTLASFANNKGGYLVFGVEDSTLKPIGVEGFEEIDSAEISNFIIEHFTSVLQFQLTTFEIEGIELGIIYVYPIEAEPIICLKTFSEKDQKGKEKNIISQGDIYFRYIGLSEKIRPFDLLKLFNSYAEKKSDGRIIEEKEVIRINDVLPIFVWQSGMSGSGNITDKFRNIGERATLLSFKEFSDNLSYVNLREKGLIEKGQEWRIEGDSKSGEINNNNLGYHIEIFFQDKDKRMYRQEFERKGTNRPIVKDPELIEK